MNNWKSLLYLVAILLNTAYCTNSRKVEEAAEDRLRTELMQVHDEVMPKMGEMTGIAGRLKDFLQQDSLLSADDRLQLEEAIGEITAAEEGMMDWMAGFRQPETLRASMDHEEIMKYLESEKNKITRVNVQIKAGIEKGKALVLTYQ